MTRSFQPARVAAAVTLGTAALLATACSAGQTAQTANQKSTVDGSTGDAGHVGLRYVRVAYPEGGRYPAGATALLQFYAVNDGPVADSLVSVRTDVASQVALQPARTGSVSASATPTGSVATGTATSPRPTPTGSPSGSPSAGTSATGSPGGTSTETATATSAAPQQASVPLPPNSLVAFGPGGATVQLIGLTEDLLPGQSVAITFTFAKNGTVTIQVPVATPNSVVPKPPPVVTTTEAP